MISLAEMSLKQITLCYLWAMEPRLCGDPIGRLKTVGGLNGERTVTSKSLNGRKEIVE